MLLGYNTNGLAHHDPLDAIALLGELGYGAVGLSIDHGLLSPRDRDWPRACETIRERLICYKMRSVIETGARYLLDPRRKHQPTLVSSDATARLAFYRHAIRCAAWLGSDCVSIWSGVPDDDANLATALRRLEDRLPRVLDMADREDVTIAFEPEPGMVVDTTDGFDRLLETIDHPRLRLTLDIGHLHCQGEPIAETIATHASRLVNVHIEDMRRGRHEHLMFGEGEIAFPPVAEALREADYKGGVYVELSRHSATGPDSARAAMEFLTASGFAGA